VDTPQAWAGGAATTEDANAAAAKAVNAARARGFLAMRPSLAIARATGA
jgi:hypothetical protein